MSKTLVFISMMRSGHHAIMDWVQERLQDTTTILDYENMRVGTVKQIVEGVAINPTYIVVLRDIPNWLASYYKYRNHLVKENVKKLLTTWVDHAQAKDVYHIKYPLWFTSQLYRLQVLKDLDLSCSSLTLPKMTKQGSLFESNVEPTKLQIMSRAQLYKNDPTYQRFLKADNERALTISNEMDWT